MTTRNEIVFAPDTIPATLIGEYLDQIQVAKNEQANRKSQEEKLRDAVSAILGQLGGMSVQDDSLKFQGTEFIIPEQYTGKLREAIKFLSDYEKQQSQKFDFEKTYNYRPFDGAHAFMEVMKQITGTTGFGVARQTFFGPQPPEFKTVQTSVHTTTQVPWGQVAFPMYEAVFDLCATQDAEKGILFQLRVNAPRRWRAHIQAIFDLVEKHVSEHSIYRGKAITGAMWPEFIDTSVVDRKHVVYSHEVMRQLTAHVWAPVRHSKQMRAQGIPLKRAVLFAGPYGTGKSMGAMLTAQEAEANGWTFVMCRTGKDDPATVLSTAALYAPAVVVIEDLDLHAAGTTALDISKILEMLDGVTNKGNEIVALFTTNHIKQIQKGALRPGRIDAVIEIAGLDPEGFEKLITISLGSDFLAEGIDWTAVAKAFEGFLPAFVKEAALRAQRFAMAENEGIPGVIGTEELILGADSLRPQLDLMEGAKEGARRHLLEDGLREVFEGTLGRTMVPDFGDFLNIEEPTVLNGALK